MNRYGYKLIQTKPEDAIDPARFKYEIYQFIDMRWRPIHISPYEDYLDSAESDAKCWIEDQTKIDNIGVIEYP